MTVRTWVTISVLTLVALFGAVAVKVFTPLRAPAILAGAGKARLHGVEVASCWPQRSGKLRCRTQARVKFPEPATIPRTGTLHLVTAYPLQPDDGKIDIVRGQRTVVTSEWTDDVRYELEAGRYAMFAEARYKRGAYVRYLFSFDAR